MKKTKTGAAGETANDEGGAEVTVTILANGALIGGCHHAAGKTLNLAKAKADVLAGMKPPQVAIIGVP